jgi:small-conductance mechanosensitive channel
MPQLPENYATIIAKLIFSLLVLVLTLVVNRLLRRLLRVRIEDPAHVRTLYMLARNAIFLIGGVVILLIWLGLGSNFTVAMGLLGAGIAFASQEIIGSLTGYLNIVVGNLFRIGDRVRIGNVVGDVLDINVLRTTVMEIGEWVGAEQYTGRIVTIANRAIFSDPVFNYTQHWPYLWDEIAIPITYSSDWRRAWEVMRDHGQAYTSDILRQAQTKLREMTRHYPVHEVSVEPTLYLVMTDAWIEMTLRYVVDARLRREARAELHREILRHLEEEPHVTIASSRLKIVDFPPLRSEHSLSYDTPSVGGI